MWKRLSLWFIENLVVFSWCHLQRWYAWDVCLQREKERSKEFKSWDTDEQSNDFIVGYCLFFVAKKVGLLCEYLGSSVWGTQLATITSRALGISSGHWAWTARSVSWSKWGPTGQDMKGDRLEGLLDLGSLTLAPWPYLPQSSWAVLGPLQMRSSEPLFCLVCERESFIVGALPLFCFDMRIILAS